MAEGILGLGSSGAASLNGELLEKLKEAERKAKVEPIETRIENITKENGESDTIKNITAKVNEFLEFVKPFDLFVTSGVNAFEQKAANVTGSSVVFDAVDVSQINEGTINVNVSQLAKRDVYESKAFSDAKTIIPTSQSINIDGTTFTTQGKDFEALASEINSNNTTITATYDASANTLTLNNGEGSGDKVFSTENKTYATLANDIQTDGTFSSSIPARPLSNDIITLSQASKPVYQSDIKVNSNSVVDSSGGKITINGNDYTVGATTTYKDLISQINLNEDLDAKISIDGRLSITHKDRKSELSITESLNTNNLGISLGEKYSTEGLSYEQLAKKINNNSSYNATVEQVGANSSKLILKSVASGVENAISITQTGVDLGIVNKVQAQNLNATIDGVEYDVPSNVIVVDGGLKITAVEENKVDEFSSISIEKDTSTVEPVLQEMVTKYNELISLIDNELYSADSSIEDKSTLRTIVEDIKGKLFDSYGENKDLNIFNFGFNIDKSGTLSLDSTKFNENLENNLEGLTQLFVGVAEREGLGTQLKKYVDSLDSFDGLLTKYEENMNSRKEALNEDKEKAQKSLDSSYALLAQQFASYGAIITQFENQFSGLKMMIEQSISGS